MSCKEDLKAQEVGNALYGLQGMSSDSEEVRNLLRSLVPKVISCKGLFNAQAVGNALYGLQGMSSDVVEVRDLLRALVPNVISCKEDLKAQAVGNALYGLQGMSSDVVEVRELLRELTTKIKSCKEHLNPQGLCNGIFGIISMNYNLTSDILFELLPRLREVTLTPDQLSFNELVNTCQTLCFLLYYLKGGLDGDTSSRLEAALNKLLLVLKNSDRKINTISSEKKVLDFIKAVFTNDKDVTVSSNDYLFGFESDVVVRTRSQIINIEVDGPTHGMEKRKRFTSRRDSVLKDRGITIIRIPTSELYGYNQEEQFNKLREKIRSYFL